MPTYDKKGNCTKCGLPGSGFVEDGVCQCLDGEPKFYVQQDGADFYLYSDEAMTNLVETTSAPFKVSDFDMEAAKKARDWFEDYSFNHCYDVSFPNPFK